MFTRKDETNVFWEKNEEVRKRVSVINHLTNGQSHDSLHFFKRGKRSTNSSHRRRSCSLDLWLALNQEKRKIAKYHTPYWPADHHKHFVIHVPVMSLQFLTPFCRSNGFTEKRKEGHNYPVIFVCDYLPQYCNFVEKAVISSSLAVCRYFPCCVSDELIQEKRHGMTWLQMYRLHRGKSCKFTGYPNPRVKERHCSFALIWMISKEEKTR